MDIEFGGRGRGMGSSSHDVVAKVEYLAFWPLDLWTLNLGVGSSHGIVAKLLDYDIVISKLEIQSRSFV